MPRFEFTVTLSGKGATREEAWEDAVEAFNLDPGTPCDEVEEFPDEDDE